MLNLILRILIGSVFIFGATSKLISIDSFEIYIYSFGVLKLDLAYFFARFVISLEFFIGVLLIIGMQTKRAILASITMLSVFSVFILYLILSENKEQCHCFGNIEMSHGSSLVKNVLLIALLLLIYRGESNKFKYEKSILIISFVFSIFLPLIVSPPDSLFYNSYSKNASYNEFVLEEYLKENSQYSKGKKMLCFFGSGCSFCKLAAKKVSVIAKKANSTDVINLVFADSQVSVDKFFRETNSTIFQYSIISPMRFLKITNGEMPLIIILEDGKIKGKYGYRDIDENEITKYFKD